MRLHDSASGEDVALLNEVEFRELTAHCGHSTGLAHAAVRPVIPAIRCNCKSHDGRIHNADQSGLWRLGSIFNIA
jgi:hypothetical protein